MRTAIETIVRVNWQGVKEGAYGAVNGAYPTAKVDTSNPQSDEFWVGINYSLASMLLLEVSYPAIQFGFTLREKLRCPSLMCFRVNVSHLLKYCITKHSKQQRNRIENPIRTKHTTEN